MSESSIGSRWCRREIALALTGELDGDDIPKVLTVRIGLVELPPAIRDKLYRTAASDRPESVVQTLYEDILAHHRRRVEPTVADEQSPLGSEPKGSLPEEPPPSARMARPVDGLRARLVGYLADTDLIRATDLLRHERRGFSEAAREAIASAESDAPGPEIDTERFRQLEFELVRCLERRLATLLPVVQFGPEPLVRDECRYLAALVDLNWGRSAASYAEWSNSPRWLASVLVLIAGAVAYWNALPSFASFGTLARKRANHFRLRGCPLLIASPARSNSRALVSGSSSASSGMPQL